MVNLNEPEKLDYFIKAVLSNYELEINEYVFLRKSENLVFKLVSKNGVLYALRIRRIVQDYEASLNSELEFLYDLANGIDIEVPRPLKAKDNSLYKTIQRGNDEYTCVVFSWVGGANWDNSPPPIDLIKSMAESTGKLHRFTSGYTAPREFYRNSYDSEWFFGTNSWTQSNEFIENIDKKYRNILWEFNGIIEERLDRMQIRKDTYGLIHYDLHIGNFKFDGNKANIIDFDELGWGFYLFDLAHIIFEYSKHEDYQYIKNTVMRIYSDVYKNNAVSEDDLDTFVGLQCIAYMNWLYRLYRRDGNTEPMGYWIPELTDRILSLKIQ